MSNPHNKLKRPDHPGQTKTMFVTEGNPTVALVIEEHGLRRADPMWFPDASHAFAWCRENRSNFVYTPAVPNN